MSPAPGMSERSTTRRGSKEGYGHEMSTPESDSVEAEPLYEIRVDVGHAWRSRYGFYNPLHHVVEDGSGGWRMRCRGTKSTREYTGRGTTVTCHRCVALLKAEQAA
jgi:hypothetical protein